MKTAALYARFSSDLQKDRSLDDQLAACKGVAAREGYRVSAKLTFSDRAKSGASMFERDGLLAMMKEAKAKGFDAVIVESLDRLSRDQADLAGIFKRLKFFDIKIITVQEGETTDIHVGIRGIVGSMFLADLGHKVKRGHNGRVREGKIPGSVTYGYRRVPGKPGEREADPEQTKVLLRIFTEYSHGVSPMKIAADLTRDKIPTPSGGANWNHQAFIGGRLGRGMIGNPIYKGELHWNQSRTVLNPETGKKLKRKTKAEDVITTSVPHLQIIPTELWNAANQVRADRSVKQLGGAFIPRPRKHTDHLLTGLLYCGTCGGHMRIANTSRSGAARVACATAHQHRTCTQTRSYDLDDLQRTVLDGIRKHLMNPRAVLEYTKSFHARWAERAKQNRTDGKVARDRLRFIEASTQRIINAIADGDSEVPVKALTAKLKTLETERVGIEERLRLMDAEGAVVAHPNAVNGFVANVAKLHEALSGNDLAPDQVTQFRLAFRAIMERFVVHPTAKRMPYEVTPYARLTALMGVDLFPTARTPKEILSEQGVIYSDPEHPEKTGHLGSNYSNRVIPLGRWSLAA